MKQRNGKYYTILLALLLILPGLSPSETSKKEDPNGIIARNASVPRYAAWFRNYIEGFAWPQSVKPGETINFYVSMDTSLGNNYDMYILRVPHQNMQDTLKRFLNLTGHFFPLHDASGTPITLPKFGGD